MKWQLCVCALIAAFLLALANSAHADPTFYSANLSGPAEFVPNNSPGTGFGLVAYDPVAHTLLVQVTFSGLIGNTTNAHIHAPTPVPLAGEASVATTTPTFVGFPAGVTGGSYTKLLDLTQASSFRAGFITASGGTVASAEAALAAALAAGKAYLNIHTTAFPGGEIRGFLLTPEPASLVTWLGGSLLLAASGWRRRQRRTLALS